MSLPYTSRLLASEAAASRDAGSIEHSRSRRVSWRKKLHKQAKDQNRLDERAEFTLQLEQAFTGLGAALHSADMRQHALLSHAESRVVIFESRQHCRQPTLLFGKASQHTCKYKKGLERANGRASDIHSGTKLSP